MGRSRPNFQSADDDPTQRSRRKKTASNGDNMESSTAGQGVGEGKKAFYHCNYCNKDITGKVRIKCAVCSDFDLCIECFSVGAEVTPHKSGHPYKVMDNLSFPLICSEWNADDEILLLEGIEMYGMGNWAEVAEHVGTKSKERCIDHFTNVYLNSPVFPLPDMSHVVGKNRKELLAMAKGQGFSTPAELAIKEESAFSSSRLKTEDSNKGVPSTRLISCSNAELDSGSRPSVMNRAATTTMAVNQPSNKAPPKDGSDVNQVEDCNLKLKKPISSGHERSSLFELSGYNPKRKEFDPEYDNDAEQLLAEMEFRDADTDEERELKFRVLHMYLKRLDERKRRKDFILERKLLSSNLIEEDLSSEEKEISQRYDVFMRFHSKEEHDELLRSVIAEHRIRKRIRELKEAHSAGCRSSAEADLYLEQTKKTKRGGEEDAAEENGRKCDEEERDPGIEMCTGMAGLLSDTEKVVCRDIKMGAGDYVKMQEVLSIQIINGNVSSKSDAHCFFKIEPAKVDTVYDMLARKGIAPSS